MKINLFLFRENGSDLDESILELLSQAKKPLSVSTISFLLNRSTRDICMELNKLNRYNEVIKVTSKRLQFWSVRSNDKT